MRRMFTGDRSPMWGLLLLVVAGCQPPPVVPSEPVDAGPQPTLDGADEEQACFDPILCACVNLCRIGCQECKPECETSIAKILRDRIAVFDVECVRRADSKPEVRACPMIKCP